VGLTVCPTNEKAEDLPRAGYQGARHEITIANHHTKAAPTFEAKKEKGDLKKTFKSSKR